MSRLSNMFGGGGNIPKFNSAPLIDTTNQAATRQRGIVNSLQPQLAGLNTQYGNTMTTAGNTFQTADKAAADAYNAGLNEQTGLDQKAADTAIDTARRTAYASLPGTQQNIKESLAATGNLKSGRAGVALAAPAVDIARNIQTLSNNLQQQGFTAQQARREAGLKALYDTQHGAALTQLGLDQDTARTLLDSGRSDLINQAASLLGIDQNQVSQILGLQTTQQLSDIAAAQSANQRRTAITGALGSLLGAGVGGFFGGVPGATVGSSAGKAGGDVLAAL